MRILSSRQWKIYSIIVGLAAVIAVFITIIVMLPGYLANKKADKDAAEKKMPKTDLLSEYMIPEEYTTLLHEKWKRFYIPKNKWTEEDIAKYWVDPEKMALQFLKTKNKTLVKDILSNYD